MAKRLFDKKGLSYKEINVSKDPRLREEMMSRTKRRTVPQIYINQHHVGDFDDLYALDSAGKLGSLLAEDTSNSL